MQSSAAVSVTQRCDHSFNSPPPPAAPPRPAQFHRHPPPLLPSPPPPFILRAARVASVTLAGGGHRPGVWTLLPVCVCCGCILGVVGPLPGKKKKDSNAQVGRACAHVCVHEVVRHRRRPQRRCPACPVASRDAKGPPIQLSNFPRHHHHHRFLPLLCLDRPQLPPHPVLTWCGQRCLRPPTTWLGGWSSSSRQPGHHPHRATAPLPWQ